MLRNEKKEQKLRKGETAKKLLTLIIILISYYIGVYTGYEAGYNEKTLSQYKK